MILKETTINLLNNENINKKTKLYNITLIGKNTGFIFYKVNSNDDSNLKGEIVIDKVNNSILYSSSYNTKFGKEITTHAR